MKRDYTYGTDILPSYTPEELENYTAKLLIWFLKTFKSPTAYDLEVSTNTDQPDRTRDSIFIKLTPRHD